MAFALVMADKQWGGYTTTATNMLNTVAMCDFGTDGTIKGGDFYVAVNPSYIAPAFYRVFAAYVTDATQRTRWMTILDKNYEILAMVQNTTTGLVPDWSAGPATNTSYGYDATRTPFRVALDACWSNDPRAKTFSAEDRRRSSRASAPPTSSTATASHGMPTSTNKNSTFVGPAGAAGMASNQPQLVADAYTRVAADAKAANDQLLRPIVGAVHGHADDRQLRQFPAPNCPVARASLPARRSPDGMIGEIFGNYRVTELIGEGGMGVVYLAEHPGIGRRAAIKILRPGLTDNAEMTKRFFNEARAANAIRHPGIVEVYDCGTLAVGHLVHRHGAARGREPGRAPPDGRAAARRPTRAASPRRRRARWPPRTPPASSTAISSPTTSSWSRTSATPRWRW